MKYRLGLLLYLSIGIHSLISAQTLPVGTSHLDEYIRRINIESKNGETNSLLIRPLIRNTFNLQDSVWNHLNNLLGNCQLETVDTTAKKSLFAFLPATIKQQYNTHHPYSLNDGAIILSKGYQSHLSLGIYTKLGHLSIQLQPEFIYAQNSGFATFPKTHSDSLWKSYYNVLNRIDNPERFRNGSYTKLLPGQSSVRFNYKKLSFGVSTENLWWGPGVRNSLIMSNNAPGFNHLTLNTSSPIKTYIGSFEGQVISGFLKRSGIVPDDTVRTFEGQRLYLPKKEDNRYLNGMIITWQPKWTKGLYLGLSRVFYQYKSNVSSSLNGYLPVATAFFKSKAQAEDDFGRDQLFSMFFRLVLQESGAEVYAEYGRNDHSQNSRDLLLEPEHARAYILGLRKIFKAGSNKQLEWFMELTHLQNPPTQGLRALEGWYNHYQVRDGYTHLGQVLGAGIGPGANSQTLGLNLWKDINKLGMTMERVVHNNDFYYDAFSSSNIFTRHWVDLSLNLNKSWSQKRFIYSANVTFVRSLNYQWRFEPTAGGNVDVNNVHANLSVSYLF